MKPRRRHLHPNTQYKWHRADSAPDDGQNTRSTREHQAKICTALRSLHAFIRQASASASKPPLDLQRSRRVAAPPAAPPPDASCRARESGGRASQVDAAIILQLSLGLLQSRSVSRPNDLAGIKGVAAPKGFRVDAMQIGCHGAEWVRLRTKARQLWMQAVTTGAALQDLLGQEGLAPEGKESLRVQILRMKGPQMHPDSRSG